MIGALAVDPSLTWSGGHAAAIAPSNAVARLLTATAKTQGGSFASGPAPAVYAAAAQGPAHPGPSPVVIGAVVLGLAAVAAVAYKLKKKRKK